MTHGRPSVYLTLALLAALVIPGCLQAVTDEPLGTTAATGSLRVIDATGAPIPLATATALDATGIPLVALSADAEGTIPLAGALTPAAATVVVAAPGHAPQTYAASAVPAAVALATLPADAPADLVEAALGAPALRFLAPVDLGIADLDPTGSCFQGMQNCGLSEPVIEVAGDGSIYVSGTCCIGLTPPVWVSRDGGETFENLRSPVREITGIEGDFAIDDAGNVYFTDILVAAGWFTSWDKDGNERYTLPIPFKPLVDRPWVRAGAEDVVYFLYNTGTSTEFHRSTDGGMTWSLSLKSFPFALGSLGQGPTNEHLVVVGGNPLTYFESRDGGATWTEGEKVPLPKGDGDRIHNAYVVLDEAENAYVTYPWRDGSGRTTIMLAARTAAGEWRGPHAVSTPDLGSNNLPWLAAQRNGTVALAWYASPGEPSDPDEVAEDRAWYLMSAVTLDALAETPHFQAAIADPEPVLNGPLGRRLLDFLQVDIGPEGAVHIAYAADRGDGNAEHTLYVRSTPALRLEPTAFPYGPTPGAGHEHGAEAPRPSVLEG